ncbi:hypothetical protein Psed_7024 (plasmid) [Pseudonocardia dioxanivorans CB1190]|uniref:Uncharacterized protein n=1 Tax=Pseudonocardia dioxanivorans (strain ATCC 55486 / DSM 44775 / JCM 13855 / CB1190) TaxID=675635 RepID=F2L7A8_PSEUX|nr:hypothetical protein [Pseudonocardia dioxanivorans]AEA29081.1 hypothetical protein Psed_7024 [Pseudonocardia dioxanivorans CB1190]
MTASEKFVGSPEHVKQAIDFIQAEFLLRDSDVHVVNITTADFYGGFETLVRLNNQLVSGARTLPTGKESNNWEKYNVQFVIFNKKISTRPWGDGYTGEPYAGLGGDFTDRVQVKFKEVGTTPDSRADTQQEIADPLPGATNALDTAWGMFTGLADFLKMLQDPGTWVRLAAAITGGAMLLVVAWKLVGARQLVGSADGGGLKSALKIAQAVR